MNKQLLKDSFGWGFVLWFIGYSLGIVLFFVLPSSLIGWVVAPIGVAITLWVLLRRVASRAMLYYVALATVWTGIAVALDYIFIVKAFDPADGYCKPDVYLYYALTFLTPLIVGSWNKVNVGMNA